MLILKSTSISLEGTCLLYYFRQDLADAMCLTLLLARVLVTAKMVPLRMKMVLGGAVPLTTLHCAFLRAHLLVTSVQVVLPQIKGDHAWVVTTRQRTN